MTTIETQRLILRKPNPSDVERLTLFYNSERSSMAGGNVNYAESVTRAYAVLGHWTHRGFGLFAITLKGDDEAIGMAGPYYPLGRPETEVGWVLFDGAEGNGYATEAALAAVKFTRETLQWKEVVHYIDKHNTRSIAVAERLGAYLDINAIQPKPDKPCLIYRQPLDEKALTNAYQHQ